MRARSVLPAFAAAAFLLSPRASAEPYCVLVVVHTPAGAPGARPECFEAPVGTRCQVERIVVALVAVEVVVCVPD